MAKPLREIVPILEWDITGRTHHQGVANEIESVKYLKKNAHKMFPELAGSKWKVKHMGGTRQKTDTLITSDRGHHYHISDKFKRGGIKKGSLDYENSSAAIKGLLKQNHPAVSHIPNYLKRQQEIRKMPLSHRQKAEPEFRAYTKQVYQKTLKGLDSPTLKTLINTHILSKNRQEHTLITDPTTRKRHLIHHDNHVITKLMDVGHREPYLKPSEKESGSARILFKSPDPRKKPADIGLRIRINLNNGVRSAINSDPSRKNKNSSLTVKFQQDNIPGLLQRSHAKEFEY